MAEIIYNGWRLVTDEDLDGDGFIRYEHYAYSQTEQKHLHGSSFQHTFWPTPERFKYLVDHDFPRSPRGGNWFNDELDELIAQENANAPQIRQPSGEGNVVEGQDERDAVVRGLRDGPEA